MKRALDRSELRSFGLTLAAFVVLVFGLFLPWVFDGARPVWPWIVAVAVALPSLLWPPAIAPVYALWRPLALAIGWINTRLILGLVFFLVILPFGLAARLAGRLQYTQSIDPDARSYRVQTDAERVPEDYERPF